MNINIITLVILIACFSSYSQEIKFKEIGYGITTGGEIIIKHKLKDSPSKLHNTIDNSDLKIKTDSIPAKIGVQFGVFYKLKSKKDILVPVNIIWSYPKGMTDYNGTKITETSYTIEKDTNYKTFSSYTLEGEYELVKGTWTFQMYHLGQKIYQKEFYLY